MREVRSFSLRSLLLLTLAGAAGAACGVDKSAAGTTASGGSGAGTGGAAAGMGGAGPGTGGAGPGTGGAGPGGTSGEGTEADLQFDGSIAFVERGPGAAVIDMARVEVSAPILPKVLVLYAQEGDLFPATPEAQAALAHDAALTYDTLLDECPAKYPGIVIPGPNDPPTTPEQNAANFEAIATCSYMQYTAKPYWIPALVDKVDICGTELGAGWHLPTEAEVSGLGESSRQQLASALATPNAAGFFGNFYFSLMVWVRGADGSLRMGDLSPGATALVSDLLVPATSTVHYEAGLALRCIRRTSIDPL